MHSALPSSIAMHVWITRTWVKSSAAETKVQTFQKAIEVRCCRSGGAKGAICRKARIKYIPADPHQLDAAAGQTALIGAAAGKSPWTWIICGASPTGSLACRPITPSWCEAVPLLQVTFDHSGTQPPSLLNHLLAGRIEHTHEVAGPPDQSPRAVHDVSLEASPR